MSRSRVLYFDGVTAKKTPTGEGKLYIVNLPDKAELLSITGSFSNDTIYNGYVSNKDNKINGTFVYDFNLGTYVKDLILTIKIYPGSTINDCIIADTAQVKFEYPYNKWRLDYPVRAQTDEYFVTSLNEKVYSADVTILLDMSTKLLSGVTSDSIKVFRKNNRYKIKTPKGSYCYDEYYSYNKYPIFHIKLADGGVIESFKPYATPIQYSITYPNGDCYQGSIDKEFFTYEFVRNLQRFNGKDVINSMRSLEIAESYDFPLYNGTLFNSDGSVKENYFMGKSSAEIRENDERNKQERLAKLTNLYGAKDADIIYYQKEPYIGMREKVLLAPEYNINNKYHLIDQAVDYRVYVTYGKWVNGHYLPSGIRQTITVEKGKITRISSW